MKDGMGLMGEAGAEAILPLKRGKDGKLGVTSTSTNSTNIVINVDAQGSTVTGEQQGRDFGQKLATAIQFELVKQKRSGGLLSQ